MKTKELIAILERELGTVESNNVVDKARDEIIKRLEELEGLKRRELGLTKDWLRERKWRLAQDETLKVIKNIIKP